VSIENDKKNGNTLLTDAGNTIQQTKSTNDSRSHNPLVSHTPYTAIWKAVEFFDITTDRDSRIAQWLECLVQDRNIPSSSPSHAGQSLWGWGPLNKRVEKWKRNLVFLYNKILGHRTSPYALTFYHRPHYFSQLLEIISQRVPCPHGIYLCSRAATRRHTNIMFIQSVLIRRHTTLRLSRVS